MKDSTSSAGLVALKPCPFCGSEPWGVFGPHEDIGSFWVECHGPADDCMTCGDWYVHNAETREDAAIAWNRRALAVEEPKPQAEPKLPPFGIQECINGVMVFGYTVEQMMRALRALPAAGIDASEGGEKDDLESAPPKVLREFARFYRQTVFLQIKELDDALSEIRNLREFAKAIMGGWPDVGGLDGFDLQLLGVKHGLLREEIRHERCGEHCSCASDAMPTEAEWKAGVQCYRKTSLLTGGGDMAGEERNHD